MSTHRDEAKAKADLLIAIKHIRYAVEIAQEVGSASIGVLSIHPNGGGQIISQMHPSFIEDVAILIGAPPLSDEDRKECAGRRLVDGILGGVSPSKSNH